MHDDTPEVDNSSLVGTPQAGDDAGDETTSGNDENAETQAEDPTEPDELDGDPDDDDGGSSESDETDDDEPGISRARQQAARYRRQLRETETERDELAEALWLERVTALGTLADPSDLPFDPDALHDPDRLRELADELVTAKPHLRSRRIRARAGQGEGTHGGGVNLAAMLARGA